MVMMIDEINGWGRMICRRFELDGLKCGMCGAEPAVDMESEGSICRLCLGERFAFDSKSIKPYWRLVWVYAKEGQDGL